jgi:hypothetical protein
MHELNRNPIFFAMMKKIIILGGGLSGIYLG